MKHPIPDAALDDRLGFVGTAGSGKTYNAGSCVERLLDTGARVVVIDPLDVWWGLRLIADGSSPSSYSMPIFGGAHGDLPLTELAGALIGETVAGMAESCIVSLGGLQTKSAERRFMLAFLDAVYRKANGEPVHLIFDEADLWAPQKSSEPMLQARMEEICRRGRVKGLIPWLITQRPAVISKDVLSQVDGLVAFKLTSSQDRDALEGWIEGQADRSQWREIRAQLPTMERGQGVVWLPGRGVLETAHFPQKRTFDSSRTPKRGEAKRSANLKPLDIDWLKDRLAKVETETKENDPKELRAKIGRLKAELASPAGLKPSTLSGEEVARAIADADQRGFDRAFAMGVNAVSQLWSEVLKITTPIETAIEQLKHWNEDHFDTVDGRSAQERGGGSLFDAPPEAWRRYDQRSNRLSGSGPSPSEKPAASPVRAATLSPQAQVGRSPADSSLRAPQQRMLDVIAFWHGIGYHAPTREQVAAVCGYSIKASTMRVVAGALKTAGLIDYPAANAMCLTPAGQARARRLTPTETKSKLESILSGAQLKVVGILQDRGTLRRSKLIELAGYSEAASTHRVVIGGLNTLGVVEYPERGVVQLSRWATEVLAQ